MRHCCWGVIAVLVLSGAPLAHGAVHKTVLDNGLTVLVNEMPSSPVAAINLWVKTGSANEGRFMASGITHFVEHMLFKGTARRPAGVIPQEAKSLGGYINASTGYDQTSYVLNVPAVNMSKAVDLLADMVANPLFDKVELEKEREVILREMGMLDDKPERKIDDLVSRTVYHVHPYQFRLIGSEDVFRNLKREDLVEYHDALYVPNNMIISVAGGIREQDVLAVVKERLGNIPARSFPLRNVPQEPEQILSRRVEVPYATDLTRLNMAYQGTALLDPDLYALDVLAMAFGDGASSRLYLDIYKKKKLVESISAWNYTPQDRGYFEVSCVLKDQDPDKAMEAVKAVIGDVQARGLMPDELAKVKRQVMADNIYKRQTAEGMADRAAAEEGFTGDADFSVRYLEGVRAVTNDDIRRVAKRYLVDQRLSVVILRSGKKEAGPADVPAADKGENQKDGPF